MLSSWRQKIYNVQQNVPKNIKACRLRIGLALDESKLSSIRYCSDAIEVFMCVQATVRTVASNLGPEIHYKYYWERVVKKKGPVLEKLSKDHRGR